MPIKDLSESVRLPRLGKIHLGIKHPEKGYPMKTEYFVLPKEHTDYKKLSELFGEKPKELKILIPVEDEEQWATQYYKAYNQTYGLVCKGDGEIALRMIDSKTGELPNKETETCTMKEIKCPGRDCPEYTSKKCHEVMNLRFMIPDVPGLGVWQIDTGSINSILNINSCAKVIKKAFGRLSMIPLKLTLEPTPVNNPETGKKQTVYVMHLRTEVTLAQLADAAREQAKTFMLEGPDLEAVMESEVEKDINELWPEQLEKQDEKPSQPAEAESEPEDKSAEEQKPKATKAKKSDNLATSEQISELQHNMEIFGFKLESIREYVNYKGWNIARLGDFTQDQIKELTQHIKDTFDGKTKWLGEEEKQDEEKQADMKF